MKLQDAMNALTNGQAMDTAKLTGKLSAPADTGGGSSGGTRAKPRNEKQVKNG